MTSSTKFQGLLAQRTLLLLAEPDVTAWCAARRAEDEAEANEAALRKMLMVEAPSRVWKKGT